MIRLRELSELRDGWFLGEGIKIKRNALILAQNILENSLLKVSDKVPKIYPMLNGTIQIEYKLPKKTIEILLEEDKILFSITHHSSKEDEEFIIKNDFVENVKEIAEKQLK